MSQTIIKQSNPAEREHALLSASGANRWLNCTPSARLEDEFPETTSEFAEEGSLAHEICELKLRKLFLEPGMPDRTFKTKHNKLKKRELYQAEMERHTDDYVDYVQKIAFGYPSAPYVGVERRVDYGHVAPEGFGTADCVLLFGNECHVIDFKYGKGVPVKAEGNPQLRLYALGVMAAYELFYQIEKVCLHIIQPRLSNFSRWDTTATELAEWAENVAAPKAGLAFAGDGEFRQGEWCGFCRASAICRERMEENLKLEGYAEPANGKMPLPPLISNAEVGEVLQRSRNLADWVSKLEKYALDELVKGSEIPGWKIVEGRSNRKITDTDAAYEALKDAGYKKALLYEPTPVSLTKAEQLISKEDYENILAKYIEKPKGKPTLAPEGDKRPAYQANPTVEEDFGGENSYKEEAV